MAELEDGLMEHLLLGEGRPFHTRQVGRLDHILPAELGRELLDVVRDGGVVLLR